MEKGIGGGGEVYFSHGTTDSCGVAILISPNLELDVTEEVSNDEGRSKYITVKINDDENLLITNVYAPTRNKVKDHHVFFNNIKTALQNLDYVHLVLGGDWNTFLTLHLTSKGRS